MTKTKNRVLPDDVFDIYERAIGGNAIFLLNIPPNREGRFSQTDVEVLSETGRRIRETYGNNLIGNADITSVLLDGDINTCIDASKPIEIKLPAAVTINRFKIQEPVAKYSERIEKVALDAWIDGTWKEISSASKCRIQTHNAFFRCHKRSIPPARRRIQA